MTAIHAQLTKNLLGIKPKKSEPLFAADGSLFLALGLDVSIDGKKQSNDITYMANTS